MRFRFGKTESMTLFGGETIVLPNTPEFVGKVHSLSP